jgi:uncharacterized Zn finger protein
MNDVIVSSTITCPHCGQAEKETMPTNACQFFYECKSCGTLLKPKDFVKNNFPKWKRIGG